MDEMKRSKSHLRRNRSSIRKRPRDTSGRFVKISEDQRQPPNKKLKLERQGGHDKKESRVRSAGPVTDVGTGLDNDDEFEESEKVASREVSSVVHKRDVKAIQQPSESQGTNTSGVKVSPCHESTPAGLTLRKPTQTDDNGPFDEEIRSYNAEIIELTNEMEDVRREDPESRLIKLLRG